MDTRTGKIVEGDWLRDHIQNWPGEEKFFIPIEPTVKQLKRGKVGRNDYCPCGSGKKFKKCCLATQ